MTVPARTEQQRREALAKANHVRSAKATAKKAMKARLLSLDEAMGLECCQTARIYELLMAVPGLGASKVTRLLSRANVPPSKTVARLSERQRDAVLELVP